MSKVATRVVAAAVTRAAEAASRPVRVASKIANPVGSGKANRVAEGSRVVAIVRSVRVVAVVTSAAARASAKDDI